MNVNTYLLLLSLMNFQGFWSFMSEMRMKTKYVFLFICDDSIRVHHRQVLAQCKEKSFQKQNSFENRMRAGWDSKRFVTEVLKREQVVVERILLKNQRPDWKVSKFLLNLEILLWIEYSSAQISWDRVFHSLQVMPSNLIGFTFKDMVKPRG